jgi:TonB-linked SusC/RagA family outer membrane protein
MVKLYLISFRTTLILLCFLGHQAWSQTKSLSGKVTSSDDGGALPGVTVLEKGTSNGTVSDAQGQFSLNVKNDATITFSFVGYTTQEAVVGNQTSLAIVLQADVAQLNEVVVIGYGTVKKEDATGSTATVDSRQFNKGIVNSPQELLQGKTAGVNISSISGAPGQTSTILIRGGSSINASNSPLIVVDGVPISNDQSGGSPNILSMINPNDIETFTVLKDASATAIYGLRASNGVIIITTKRGGSKMKITYTGTVTAYSDPKNVQVYTGDQFRTLVNQLYPGVTAITSILGPDGTNTNWQKQIYRRPAYGQDHNLSISGTELKTPYRISLGYNNTDGILKTYNYQRTTLSVSLDPRLLNDHLKISVNVKAMNNGNNFADQSAIANAVSYDPTQSVKNGNTTYAGGYTSWTIDHTPNGAPNNLATPNPVAQLAATDNTSNQMRSIGNVKFDYQLPVLPDLHLILNLGYDYLRTHGHNNIAPNTQWQYVPTVMGGKYDPYVNVGKNQLLDMYGFYSKDLKSLNSKIDFTGGYSFAHFYTSAQDSTMDAKHSSPAILKNVNFTEYYLISFFGRLNYTYKNKYLLTASLRDDGTSRFDPSLRWGLFPSVAGKWKIIDEQFMRGIRMVSDLGIRIGYGVTGQQDIFNSNYPYIPTYTVSDQSSRYQLGNTFYNTLRPDAYNAKIQWETTATINLGVDYGIFGNKVTGSIDVYQKNCTNLIAAVPPAIGTNFGNSVLSNVGNSINKGIEFNISSPVIATRDLQWTVGYNFTIQNNKITKLSLNNDPNFYIPTGAIGNTTGGTIQAQRVGYARNSYYVYQQVYDSHGKPIEDTYVDRNHDGVINSADMYMYKQPNAKVFMGINSRLNYKRWDFAFTGRVSLGNYNYNEVAANATYQAIYTSTGGSAFLSNVSTQASATQFKPALNTRFSDYYVQNASFFRMDNINFGYSFPKLWRDNTAVRVGAGVTNAFVITKYKGVDPEISGGLDNSFFPRSRAFFVNANFTF